MANVIDGVKYTKDHEWVKIEGENAIEGLSDYAQSELSDIVMVELPEVGKKVKAGDSVGTIEAVKAERERLGFQRVVRLPGKRRHLLICQLYVAGKAGRRIHHHDTLRLVGARLQPGNRRFIPPDRPDKGSDRSQVVDRRHTLTGPRFVVTEKPSHPV